MASNADVIVVAGSRKNRIKMPGATSIVARSYPDKIIGIDNELPWHLGTDLRLFKRRTIGHAIIMGRKTFESIGKPLPKRLNIVLSRESMQDSEHLKWAKDPETALLLADIFSICSLKKEFFVIGGEKIYDVFFDYINKIYLTDVFCKNINGDAKFDYEFSNDVWTPEFQRALHHPTEPGIVLDTPAAVPLDSIQEKNRCHAPGRSGLVGQGRCAGSLTI